MWYLVYIALALEIPTFEIDPLNMPTSNDGEGVVYSVADGVLNMAYSSTLYEGQSENTPTQVVFKATHEAIRYGNTGSQARLKSLIRELLILSHEPISTHPNIVTLYGVAWSHIQPHDDDGDVSREPLLQPRPLLEQADGTLTNFLQGYPELPLRAKFSIIRQIAESLAALHACNIVHGDVKPENVLMFGETPKISDFSHSRLNASSVTSLSGTRGYQAPEVIYDEVQSGLAIKADIFSFAVVAFQILYSRKQTCSFYLEQASTIEYYASTFSVTDIDDSYYWNTMSHCDLDFQSTADPEEVWALIECIFSNSVIRNPQHRNLIPIIEALAKFEGTESPPVVSMSSHVLVPPIHLDSEVCIRSQECQRSV